MDTGHLFSACQLIRSDIEFPAAYLAYLFRLREQLAAFCQGGFGRVVPRPDNCVNQEIKKGRPQQYQGQVELFPVLGGGDHGVPVHLGYNGPVRARDGADGAENFNAAIIYALKKTGDSPEGGGRWQALF